MSDTPVTDLLNKLPSPLRDSAVLYAPAISRMASADFFAFVRGLQEGQTVDAMAKLRAAMTAEELADEKSRLADLTVVMARESWEARQIGLAVLRAALIAALSAAGL
jgi:hypothetical protein